MNVTSLFERHRFIRYSESRFYFSLSLAITFCTSIQSFPLPPPLVPLPSQPFITLIFTLVSQHHNHHLHHNHYHHKRTQTLLCHGVDSRISSAFTVLFISSTFLYPSRSPSALVFSAPVAEDSTMSRLESREAQRTRGSSCSRAIHTKASASSSPSPVEPVEVACAAR